jgi:hypothetical protein
MSGEIKFEKAYAEFTDDINGYGIFLAHSCDGLNTFLEAQNDAQNPQQLSFGGEFAKKEEGKCNYINWHPFTIKNFEICMRVEHKVVFAEEEKMFTITGNWSVPEASLPKGWREKLTNMIVKNDVDTAVQYDGTHTLIHGCTINT